MQPSIMSSTTTQSDLSLIALHTTHRTESTKTNSSDSSQLSYPPEKASTRFVQKLKKLKARMSKPKMARQESEKGHIMPPAEGLEDTSSIDLELNKQDEAKAGRREAQRAKWSARRSSLKNFVKKTGKAVAISGAVGLAFIFGPILIVIDLAGSLMFLVIRLLIELAELICIPFYVCFAW